MKMINDSYRSISFVVFMNMDRLVIIAMITGALALASVLFSQVVIS